MSLPNSVLEYKAEFMANTQEGSDLMMSRLVSDDFTNDFIIEEVLFLSALRLAGVIAHLRERKQTVYMLGFDFMSESGYSSKVKGGYSSEDKSEINAKIKPQEFYFLNALYMLQNSEIEVKHVGYRSFSKLSPTELNELFLPEQRSSRHLVERQQDERVLITAELTTNHFGDRHRLERMVRSAKAAGADFVKVQKRNVETFYSQEQLASKYVSPFGDTFRDYRLALELGVEDFNFLDKLCKELDIKWFASILDEKSFHFMMQFSPDMIKLPSTISEHKDYLKYVADKYKGSIVLSTGMTDKVFEEWVLETFINCDKLYLMQCNSAYPTPLHDCNIAVVRHYSELAKENSRIVPGYSSHDFGWFASALAVGAGAKIIEKHVKLGNTEWAHFDAVAIDLTTSDFHEFVSKIRDAEMIMGSGKKKINESEHHKYRK